MIELKNKLRTLVIRVFFNHETNRKHWEQAAKINPYHAVCTSAKSLEDIAKIKDSVVYHGGVEFKGKAVLDVCCGVGRIARFIGDSVESYTGVDWSKTMVETANNLYKSNPRVRFVVNNGSDLAELNTDTYDLAVCELAFLHMKHESTERYIREVLRVLKPGGVFLAQIPRRDFYDVYPEYQGRGYGLEEAKATFTGYNKVEHIEGYNHNYAFYLIKATKGISA